MSPRRVADAANIAPYLTHAVSHHGQQTLVPPDNAGRVRKVKPRKNRSRTRPDRNVRSEEEIRFNTGSPRSMRSPAVPASRGGRRPTRAARQDRTNPRDDEYDEFSIPDYPPPSFQEAISTPPTSIYPSTTTLVNIPQPPPSSFAGQSSAFPHDPQPSSTPSSHQLPAQPPTSSNTVAVHSDSESDDSSLEIIEMDPEQRHIPEDHVNPLQEGRTKERTRRRGVEFPTPSSSQSEHSSLQNRDETPSEGSSRGRLTVIRTRGILESDPEDVVAELEPPTPKVSKRRHLSLSPLRTLFPYRPSGILDHTTSAHPSPTSPYSLSRSAPSFFRSTTSLRMPLSTPSLLKLPLSTSTTPSTRSENFRKLFPSKGKERAKSLHENEALEAWELLDSDPPPHSIMSALESVKKPSSPLSGVSCSTQTQSFSLASSSPDPGQMPPITSTLPEEPRPPDSIPNAHSTHPLSMRDRKPPPPPFVSRHVRRAPPPPPVRGVPLSVPVSPNSTSTPIQGFGTGPPLTSVRTKKSPIPPPKKKSQVITSSPLGADSWRADEAGDSQSIAIFQRALETPLPATPVDAGHFEYGPRTPLTPTFTNMQHDLKNLSMSTTVTSSGATHNEEDTAASPYAQSPFADSYENRTFYGPPTPSNPHSSDSSFLPKLAPVRASSPSSDESSVFTRHYHGRPLPRPPASIRTMVDSIYAAHEDVEFEATTQIDAQCPGGLLIDFEETSSADDTRSGSSILAGRCISQDRSQIEWPTTSPSTSAEFFTGNSYAPASTPHAIPHSGREPSPAGSPEITDLDVLVSRLGSEQECNGADYDTLLLVSEFIGPASPYRGNAESTSSSAQNTMLPGVIKFERRRVMADGRVKLKLSLLGIGVDRCGICLSQFKDGQSAGMSASCRHVFHDRCLGHWLSRSRTCPLCRVPLNVDGQ